MSIYNTVIKNNEFEIMNIHPPSLPPKINASASKPIIPCLEITILDLTYLEINATKPRLVRYKWWGSKQNNKYQFFMEQSPHRFCISVSQAMFIRYCTDMKILQFDIADQIGKNIATGFVNFGVLRGWDGRQCQIKADLKNKSNIKVGQILMKMEIIEINNPLHVNPETNIRNIQNENNQRNSRKRSEENEFTHENGLESKKTQPYRKRKLTNIQQQKNNEIKKNFLDYEELQPQQQYIFVKPIESWKEIRKPALIRPAEPPTLTQKQQIYQRLNLPLPDPCICPDINSTKLSLQKMRLRQEVQLFFSKQHGYEKSKEQFSIEVVGWEPINKADRSLSCKLVVPAIDQNGVVYANQYSFARPNGDIKMKIEGTVDQHKLKKYLANQNIDVCIGDYIGSIPLYRVVASQGQVITCSVNDKKKKEILKGHFSIRMVPKLKQQQSNTIEKPSKNEQQLQKSAPETTIKTKEQYMWAYLQQVHFVEPTYYLNSNIFCQIKPSSTSTSIKTKTIWNTEYPKFNQILTLLLPSNRQIVIQVWNRKQTDRLIGTATLIVKQMVSFEQVEVSVVDFYGRVQGYIGVCVGVGDLVAATQFLNTHVRAINKHNIQVPSSRQHKKSESGSQPQPSPHIEYSQKSPSSPESEQNSLKSSQIKNSSSQSHIPDPLAPNSDMSIIQLHNHIFTTYLKKDYDWLSTYRNSQPSLSELSILLKPFCDPVNATKFCSVYLLQKNSNLVSLLDIKESLEAFQVYYNIISDDRDRTTAEILELISQQDLSINQLQDYLTKKSKPRTDFWATMKQYIQPTVVEKLRYFYNHLTAEQVCDCLRKFQVYETTFGEQVDIQIIKRQVMQEITDVLELDSHSPTLRTSIKQAGLQLSKFELLCLFGQLPRIQSAKMIKSPTFGFLSTQRPPAPVLPSANPSLALNLQNSSIEMSKNFGHPDISPIHHENTQKKRQKLKVGLMDVSEVIQQIEINGKMFVIDDVVDGFIELSAEKSFSYKGFIWINGIGKVEFEGGANDWMGLVGEDGNYCGSVCFQ